MLYDPRWEKTTKADPLSLESLIAWLADQQSNKTYCYMSNGQCLFATYLKFHGYKDVNVGGYSFFHGPRSDRQDELLPAHFVTIAEDEPHTYGAALARARMQLTSSHRGV